MGMERWTRETVKGEKGLGRRRNVGNGETGDRKKKGSTEQRRMGVDKTRSMRGKGGNMEKMR